MGFVVKSRERVRERLRVRERVGGWRDWGWREDLYHEGTKPTKGTATRAVQVRGIDLRSEVTAGVVLESGRRMPFVRWLAPGLEPKHGEQAEGGAGHVGGDVEPLEGPAFDKGSLEDLDEGTVD